ncbi:MAG: CHASE domain-containing protein [Alphaproteobacteria bacterium]|nr:CHASE domain-containing protein [Alphaproteobacteria bacterium]MBU0805142.1 CHASE domain-containing protein [Alphaproteobacteria bacterium]MBU0870641.1 CHASE domain-containing protein [Alphaproteobacteria bacterium]MBU1401684.1 CHASE domain-containing protein [Alphaproteobacteria bacterium]MBU1591899.1 CHASE domain-containing protein [Alphaproteobacteria bacterium]
MKKHFPLVAFIAVAIASVAMATFAYVAAEDATRIKFEAIADDAINRIEGRIDLHVSLLHTTHAMFVSQSADVSAAEFRAYFEALDVPKKFEGLRGLGFLGLARAGQDARLEARLTELQGAPKPIFPTASDGDWRTPVLLYEVNDGGDTKGIGYDMFSDPLRRDAILAALETGEPRATGRVELGAPVGAEVRPGFLLFSSVETVQSGDGTPAGILFASFRTQDLFKAALEKFPVLPVHAEVFHGEPTLSNRLFASKEPAVAGGDLVATRQMLVAGVPWTIQFHPTADFSRPSSRAIPILLGIFGLLLAVAIALVQRYQGRAYDAMSQLREASETSLQEKDLMLQEMKHRIKNSISRVLAIARQTAGTAEDIDTFSKSFSARLQAMAASQDMLTRSRWQKADLGELLQIELAQAFGKELPEGMLDGPRVLLSEAMTQALGLTFHELATNALKYGEVGNSTETLKVDWKVLRNGREKRLVLHWREASSTPIAVPEKTGFGTKLIDMNITRELGGTIERGYREDGLEIEISIPLRGEA